MCGSSMAPENAFLSFILHFMIILEGLYRNVQISRMTLRLPQHLCFWLEWFPALRSILSKRWLASHEAKVELLTFQSSYFKKGCIFYFLLLHFVWWPWIWQAYVNSPWLHRARTIIFVLLVDNVDCGGFSDVIFFFFHRVLIAPLTWWAYLIVILLFARVDGAYFLELWVFILLLMFHY